MAVSEAERRLDLEGLTTARIVSDERLAVETWMLFPAVRTKVRATFEVSAGVGEGLRVRVSTGTEVGVVYGEAWDERKMARVVSEGMSGCGGKVLETDWSKGVRLLRAKLATKVPRK